MKKFLFAPLAALTVLCSCAQPIDRLAVVSRNNPHLTAIDTLASLTVGNGGFAYTADVTGMQTWPELYSKGIPLGTQSDWGWHSFVDTHDYRFEETLVGGYACQLKDPRGRGASDWFRNNPHRLHLGCVGFWGIAPQDVSGIDQTLDLWTGQLHSRFALGSQTVEVVTACDPEQDEVAFDISNPALTPVSLRFAYPTGQHSDDACDWHSPERHSTELVAAGSSSALLRRTLDTTTYYVSLRFSGASVSVAWEPHTILVTPSEADWTLSVEWLEDPAESLLTADAIIERSAEYWSGFWTNGGIVDFGACTDPRAPEMERRVVLSQYLMAVNCAGDTPPQETGLTYNSWFGKFHLEMIWWHQSHFPLWGHPELLDRSLGWYESVADYAGEIAARQGFEGVRWMKMTDPSGAEAPSNVGSFLIWQEPHIIYLAELLYRANPSQEVLDKYYDLIQQTAVFMASYATYDAAGDRYVLKGCIPAQETLKASETVNPPFELSYWHFGLSLAQTWRERMGEERVPEWDEIISKLSHLAAKDGLYLAAESHPQTYQDIRCTSDHPIVLGAVGFLPECPLLEMDTMENTLDWILAHWNWDETWGWDYPLVAMNAARLGRPDAAVDALLLSNRTNTCLPNGHNYQDSRLRLYLPGNGGLLTAVAMMCAGWDGCTRKNPGWPSDGTWKVRWEGLQPLP